MFIQSPDDLIEELTEHPLLEPSQFAELTSTLRSSFSNHDDLARELMRRGWLTSFQVELLLLRQGGDLVLGSYVLFDLIGEGHMGKVYKARQMPIGRVVAVKVIRPKHLDNPDAVRRFEREIRATAKLSHPNVITALDAGRSGDSSFLVMDYCEGTDLHRLVRKQGPLAVLQAVDYTRQAALGLQHAHERGLVHRDVKPSNLLVNKPSGPSTGPGPSITDSGYRSPHGVVKVLDLGLARLVAGDGSPADGSREQVTTSGWIIGTPDYVAPEQTINAHAADIRSDLYSLGCTLYFMLTGQPPFPDASGAEKFHMHRNVEPTPVEQIRGDVPPRVGQIVRKLMAKQPRDRYQVPSQLSTELAGLLVPKALGGLSAIHANPPVPAAVPPVPARAVGGDDGAAPLAGWPLLFVVGCIVGGVLLVVVACLTMLRG